jgi:FtsP/CotA-like multicopper oxidase with cupredoxin domain
MTHVSSSQFSAGLAALAGASALQSISVMANSPLDLVARPGSARLHPASYPETQIWGYQGEVPGPVIRRDQEVLISRRFVNDLPHPYSIHWHGIRIAKTMVGVAGLTQPAVAPDDGFLYDFEVPNAGTHWDHPHNRTGEQMALGLYGALIAEEPEGAPEMEAE